jgi:hypothetical protein
MDVDGGLEFTNAENPYMGTLSNFTVDKKIGKGQFSEVYRAVCKVDGRVVALKKVQVCLDCSPQGSVTIESYARYLTRLLAVLR